MNRTLNGCLGLIKGSVIGAAIGTGLLLLSGLGARAESVEHCQRRIAHADHELHEAIEHHGLHSRQAKHERRELHEVRERCWREHHQWWDEHQRRWRTDREWDDRDHDRDDYRDYRY
jgi:hypothetical protein